MGNVRDEAVAQGARIVHRTKQVTFTLVTVWTKLVKRWIVDSIIIQRKLEQKYF